MSTRAVSWAIDNAGNLSGAEFKVLVFLADSHNRTTGRCDPSVSRIAECLGIDTRWVRRIIRDLEGKNLLSANRANGTRNSYSLNITEGDHHPGSPSPRVPITPGDCDPPTGGDHHPGTGGDHHPPNRKEPERTGNKRRARVRVSPPEWLPDHLWDSWLTHLGEKGKYPKQSAQEAQIRRLDRLRADEPLDDIVERAIAGNWQSFHPSGRAAAQTPSTEIRRNRL